MCAGKPNISFYIQFFAKYTNHQLMLNLFATGCKTFFTLLGFWITNNYHQFFVTVRVFTLLSKFQNSFTILGYTVTEKRQLTILQRRDEGHL